MSDAETQFHGVGGQIAQAEPSQMFGKACYKMNGKAFVCFFQDCMVFKLTGDQHAEALALDGSTLFDPSGKGRAMKEWVQVPFDHHSQWPHYARAAKAYVTGQ